MAHSALLITGASLEQCKAIIHFTLSIAMSLVQTGQTAARGLEVQTGLALKGGLQLQLEHREAAAVVSA